MGGYAESWLRSIALIAFPGLLLAACASPPVDSSGYLREGGSYRVGVPYQINGVWYYPAVDYNYDRTGIASWYGEEFEGRLTANGEIFDLNALTAAHTTLPMPSIVQVTNLENGRSLQLRVNDRGPFVDGRLIDVSRRAAQLLGFESRGTTLVRVTVLKEESIAAAEDAMHNGQPIVLAAASSAAPEVTPAPRPAPTYAAAAERRWAPEIPVTPTRRIEPAATAEFAAKSSLRHYASAPESAIVPVKTRAEPRSTQTAMAEPQARSAPSTPPRHYQFSLITRAEAAEMLGEPAPARKVEIRPNAAAPAKLPPSSRLVGEPRGPARVFIQAGAFARRDNAERVQSRMAHWGGVQVMPSRINGVAMYRVRLGPFASEAQAARLLTRIVSEGYPGARIVSD
jgi:rare lipoprotein A